MLNNNIPLLKEYRLGKIVQSLECIDKNPYNRDKQKDCVLTLYNRSDKSTESLDKAIFRGMVIPTLRYMGLIIGQGDSIRLSANGKLIVESKKISDDLFKRAILNVVFEIDNDVFKFLELFYQSQSIKKEDYIEKIIEGINKSSKKQMKERIKKWLLVLEKAGFIESSQFGLSLNESNYNYIKKKPVLKNFDIFKKIFFQEYNNLGLRSAGIVDIVDLREFVAIKLLKDYNIILTEKNFDELLNNMPFETDNYKISFGKPMGSQEKLLKYKNNYFKTVFIRTSKGRKYG